MAQHKLKKLFVDFNRAKRRRASDAVLLCLDDRRQAPTLFVPWLSLLQCGSTLKRKEERTSRLQRST